MDKKILYGLGAVAVVGALWYWNKNRGQASATDMAMGDMGMGDMTDAGADAGAGGGGGGASAPSPSDMAMGEVAKEDLKKSMDLGGLDMASPKAEAIAKNMAIATSMAVKGKDIPVAVAKQVAKSPMTNIKSNVGGKVVATLKNVGGGISMDRTISNAKGVGKGVVNLAKKVESPIYQIFAKKTNVPTSVPKMMMGKPVAVIGKPVAVVSKAVSKPVVQAKAVVSKAVAKPVASIKSKLIAKKGFDGLDSYSFDGMDDMF
jgi:hypothetical protein